MKIALIDDGIASDALKNSRVVEDLEVWEDGRITPRSATAPILTDHGTTCAQIIELYTEDVSFCSLRIFHAVPLNATPTALAAALQWCCDNDVAIVHMSVGDHTIKTAYLLQPYIALLQYQKKIIVAAYSNDGKHSAPACFAGVLSVCADSKLENLAYHTAHNANCLIQASAKHTIERHGRVFTTQLSNSYAAPTVTAAAHNMIQGMPAHTIDAKTILEYMNISNQYEPTTYLHARILDPDNSLSNLDNLCFSCSRALNAKIEGTVPTISLSVSQCYTGLIPYSTVKAPIAPYWLPESEIRLPIDINVVFVIEAQNIALPFAAALQNALVQEGWQCIGLSDYEYGNLYGFFPAETNNLTGQLSALEEIYNAEIAVCCLKTFPCDTVLKALYPDAHVFVPSTDIKKARFIQVVSNITKLWA